jgi:hypothetical protein
MYTRRRYGTKRLVQEAGGVAVAMGALQRFPGSEAVQLSGTALLRSLGVGQVRCAVIS